MFYAIVAFTFVASCVQAQTQLTLPKLPYNYNELEPVLSEHIMHLHHDKHFHGYINKTNAALKSLFAETGKEAKKSKEFAQLPIESILTRLAELPKNYQIIFGHQAGGYLNHKLFFSMLRKPTETAEQNKPTGALLEAITKSFSSFEKFQEYFTDASLSLFGSGWVWLYIEAKTGRLVLNYTANQDNPIMFDPKHHVVLGIDLWEHAYYPVYENRRNEYIANFWRIINWDYVSQLFAEGQKKRADL